MRLLTALLLLGSVAWGQIDPVDAVDINPSPDIVEINLVAEETTWEFKPGVPTTVYAYNGTIPGPTIRANVDNQVIINFTNNLPEPTTIHWHGLEISAAMDGSHISQEHIQPGETFQYRFQVKRDALYWYHPHVRTFDQVEKGLYGAFLVKDPSKEAALGLTNVEEHILVFDDVLLDANDEIVPAFSFTDPLEHALYQLNGREGNLLLLNGVDASTRTLNVPNGMPQRWRVVNAANTTFCRLNISDAEDGFQATSLFELGADGGFNEFPYPRTPTTVTGITTEHPAQALLGPMGEGILCLPGQRLDVLFTPIGADGESFTIYQVDWLRGRHVASYSSSGTIVLGDDPMDGFYPDQPFLEVITDGPDPGLGQFNPPAVLSTFPPPPKNIDITLSSTFGHGDPNPTTGDVTLFAQASFPGGVLTPAPAAKIDSFNAQDALTGQTAMWEVTNLTHGDHPFHTHGFFFELVEYEFQDDLAPSLNFTFEPDRRIIFDTIRVPARLGAKGTSRTIARLRTNFTPNGGRDVEAMGTTPTFDRNGDWTSGGWLFHCHVLEHSGKGMLSFYEMRDPTNPFVLLGKELNGSKGKVSLTALGDLSPGTDVEFDIVNAVPNTSVVLLIGNSLQNLPYNGGTIVPSFDAMLTGQTDGNGFVTLAYSDWETFPSGTEFYVQAAVLDPLGLVPIFGAGANASQTSTSTGRVGGNYTRIRTGDIALSNALMFTTP